MPAVRVAAPLFSSTHLFWDEFTHMCDILHSSAAATGTAGMDAQHALAVLLNSSHTWVPPAGGRDDHVLQACC
jgi:hypothetical protein